MPSKANIDLSKLRHDIEQISKALSPQEFKKILHRAMTRTTKEWKRQSDIYIDHGEKQKFRKSIRTTSSIEAGEIVAYSRSGHPLAHLIEDGTVDRWRGPDKLSIARAVLSGSAKLPQGKWYTGRMPAYKLLEKAVNATEQDVIDEVDAEIRKAILAAARKAN